MISPPAEVDAVRRFKVTIDGHIGMSGSATTARWLLGNGLLDELRLLVHPIAVGHGQRLFDDSTTHKLKLLDSETLSTGVLNLTYAPASYQGRAGWPVPLIWATKLSGVTEGRCRWLSGP